MMAGRLASAAAALRPLARLGARPPVVLASVAVAGSGAAAAAARAMATATATATPGTSKPAVVEVRPRCTLGVACTEGEGKMVRGRPARDVG